MTDILEALMLTAFSTGWYFSVVKMLRTRQAAGKSLSFICIIAFGYACGAASKATEWAATGDLPLLILLYGWNMAVVLFDAVLVVLLSRSHRFSAARTAMIALPERHPPDTAAAKPIVAAHATEGHRSEPVKISRNNSPVGLLLRTAAALLDAVAESDRRYREKMRIRGMSDEMLRDIGLTRGQLANAFRAPPEGASGARAGVPAE